MSSSHSTVSPHWRHRWSTADARRTSLPAPPEEAGCLSFLCRRTEAAVVKSEWPQSSQEYRHRLAISEVVVVVVVVGGGDGTGGCGGGGGVGAAADGENGGGGVGTPGETGGGGAKASFKVTVAEADVDVETSCGLIIKKRKSVYTVLV